MVNEYNKRVQLCLGVPTAWVKALPAARILQDPGEDALHLDTSALPGSNA